MSHHKSILHLNQSILQSLWQINVAGWLQLVE